MKKKLIMTLLLTTLSLTLIIGGCTKSNPTKTNTTEDHNQSESVKEPGNTTDTNVNDPNVNEKPVVGPTTGEDSNLDQGEYVRRSNEEMYKLYESNLQTVRDAFGRTGLDIEEIKGTPVTNYKDYTDTVLIKCYTPDHTKEYSLASYDIATTEDGDIMFLSAVIEMNIDKNKLATTDFKFEDTLLQDIHNILNPDKDVTSEMNQGIKDRYKNSKDTKDIFFKEDKIQESLYLGEDTLSYTILIHP